MGFLTTLKTIFQTAPSRPPGECHTALQKGEALLVDVREPDEWAAGVARSAHLLSLSHLAHSQGGWTEFLAEVKGREVLLYCASGGRSGFAAKTLLSRGIRAVNTGGLSAWAQSGWPVEKPRRR